MSQYQHQAHGAIPAHTPSHPSRSHSFYSYLQPAVSTFVCFSCLSATTLLLPLAYHITGAVVGVTFLVLCATLSYFSSLLLIDCAYDSQTSRATSSSFVAAPTVHQHNHSYDAILALTLHPQPKASANTSVQNHLPRIDYHSPPASFQLLRVFLVLAQFVFFFSILVTLEILLRQLLAPFVQVIGIPLSGIDMLVVESKQQVDSDVKVDGDEEGFWYRFASVENGMLLLAMVLLLPFCIRRHWHTSLRKIAIAQGLALSLLLASLCYRLLVPFGPIQITNKGWNIVDQLPDVQAYLWPASSHSTFFKLLSTLPFFLLPFMGLTLFFHFILQSHIDALAEMKSKLALEAMQGKVVQHHKQKRRLTMVMKRVYMIMTLLYLCITVVGDLLLFQLSTNSSDAHALLAPNRSGDWLLSYATVDASINIARASMVVIICVSIPVIMVTLRELLQRVILAYSQSVSGYKRSKQTLREAEEQRQIQIQRQKESKQSNANLWFVDRPYSVTSEVGSTPQAGGESFSWQTAQHLQSLHQLSSASPTLPVAHTPTSTANTQYAPPPASYGSIDPRQPAKAANRLSTNENSALLSSDSSTASHIRPSFQSDGEVVWIPVENDLFRPQPVRPIHPSVFQYGRYSDGKYHSPPTLATVHQLNQTALAKMDFIQQEAQAAEQVRSRQVSAVVLPTNSHQVHSNANITDESFPILSSDGSNVPRAAATSGSYRQTPTAERIFMTPQSFQSVRSVSSVSTQSPPLMTLQPVYHSELGAHNQDLQPERRSPSRSSSSRSSRFSSDYSSPRSSSASRSSNSKVSSPVSNAVMAGAPFVGAYTTSTTDLADPSRLPMPQSELTREQSLEEPRVLPLSTPGPLSLLANWLLTSSLMVVSSITAMSVAGVLPIWQRFDCPLAVLLVLLLPSAAGLAQQKTHSFNRRQMFLWIILLTSCTLIVLLAIADAYSWTEASLEVEDRS